jgi:plastocyanin
VALAAVPAQANTVHVQVGPNNSLIFNPASVTINVGDTVQWDWVGNNHTVTSGGCCNFNGLFDLGNTSNGGPPAGQNAGFSASHTFTQPGSFPYFCRVHGSNFGMTGVVNVLTPDYTINIPTSNAGPVFPGQTGTFNGTLISQSGYNSAVALSCQPLAPASQPSCAVNPTSAIPSTAGTPFTIGNDLSPGLPPVDLQFEVHGAGSDGTNHNSQVLTLKVVNFDFSGVGDLTTGPSGSSATETFLASGFNGFTGTVTFSCGQLPANANCVFGAAPSSMCANFSPGNVIHLTANNPGVCMSLRVTTNQTPGGVYAVNVTASTPGAPDFSRSINLTVPDYAISVADPLITVFPGGGGTFNTALASLGNFSASMITITCGTGDPTVQCVPSSSPIALAANAAQNFTVTFTTTAGTQPKDYVANISASDGNGLNHAVAVTIRVLDIALGIPSPSTISVAQGNPAAPVALAISALGNWNPTITLACSGPAIAAGASCVFSPGVTLSPGPNGTVNASLVILSNNAPPGSGTVTVTASATLVQPKTARVQVGLFSNTPKFMDSVTMSGTTDVHVGDIVEWDWTYDIYDSHSTTSGTPPVAPNLGPCASNASGTNWDSGVCPYPHSYSVTFSSVGSFPYYCRVHGALYNMVGTVNVSAAPATTKTQNITLNIGAGTGSADLQVVVTPLPSVTTAVPVGSKVTFTADVSNQTAGPFPATTTSMIFNGPVTINPSDLPAQCNVDGTVAQAVDCTLTTPVSLAIPVTVGFGRTVTAQAFLASGAADSNPANNQDSKTVQVRPRPFSRNGLPVIIP